MTTYQRAMSLVVISLFTYTLSWAQTEKAIHRGTVTDPSGAVISGATVAVTEVTTNVEVRRVTTDGNGSYEIPELKPTTYRVAVEQAGFRKLVTGDVLLDPGQARRVDVKLVIGSTADAITVSAGAALIQTEGGSISAQLDTKLLYVSTPTVDIY